MHNVLSTYVFTNHYYPSYIPQILLNPLARANSVPGIAKEVRTLSGCAGTNTLLREV